MSNALELYQERNGKSSKVEPDQRFLNKRSVTIINFMDDYALFYRGSLLGVSYSEDALDSFTMLQEIGASLSAIDEVPSYALEVQVNWDDDNIDWFLQDWNWEEVATFVKTGMLPENV
jgi:hypothetical protein